MKELRKSYNYSQEFVASRLNITRQTYSHYETGRISPPVNSLYNLSKLYNIPINNFLELTINPTQNLDSSFKETAKDKLKSEDLSKFLNYISTPNNAKKFSLLERNEKLLLYYFQLLDSRDQDDILTFMKIKCSNRIAEQKTSDSSEKTKKTKGSR